ncbi:MAG: L,D-transpeptidase [Gammaproteobacteria bacterium]|nr:L,D-transpeptidase [Gammaproteobacteria bacterium]
MPANRMKIALFSLFLYFPLNAYCQIIYEIDGASTSKAPYDRRYVVEDGYVVESDVLSTPHEVHEKNRVHEIDSSPYASNGAPIPAAIKAQGEKLILVDPKEHAWGAYNATGQLIRWGLATAGANWCNDTGRPCRTKEGVFRIYSSGDETCISTKFPIPEGGAPMPYCMYFNGGEALHGSNEVVYDNVSHGCVRLHVSDAKWLRYQFAEGPNATNHYRGTKVIIKSY